MITADDLKSISKLMDPIAELFMRCGLEGTDVYEKASGAFNKLNDLLEDLKGDIA